MNFAAQPTLRSDLLEIRPLREADFPALFAVAADPLIWEQHPAQDRYQEEVFREFFEESLTSGGALLVTDLAAGSVIGSSRFHGYSEAKSEIEIGWTFLARSHWGGTYNGDLKSIMLRHAFRFVESVVFLIDKANLRYQRAAAKIGAVAEPRPDEEGRMVFRLYRGGVARV